jgi:hypothetical protein
MVTRLAFAIAALAACRTPHAVVAERPTTRADADELTLFRDRTLVKQRVELDIPTADKATVTVRVPIGVNAEDVVVLDRGDLTISELRASGEHAAAAAPAMPKIEVDSDETTTDEAETPAEDEDELTPPPAVPTTPTEITLVATGPHAGHFALALGYVTDRIKWDAAYTMTTTPARTHVSLRGAIAIRNTTGIAFPHARAYVIDTELGAWRGRLAEQFASLITSGTSTATASAEPRGGGAGTRGGRASPPPRSPPAPT